MDAKTIEELRGWPRRQQADAGRFLRKSANTSEERNVLSLKLRRKESIRNRRIIIP